MSMYEQFGPLSLGSLERKINKGDYIDPIVLAKILRANPGVVFSDVVIEYVCESLDGKIKNAGGRPNDGVVKFLAIASAINRYEQYFNWLKHREKRAGWNSKRPNSDTDWWQGPPSERAARMVAKRFSHYNWSWRHVSNFVSSYKRLNSCSE